MTHQAKILLQTTIAPDDDDWSIGRFTLLVRHLEGLTDSDGSRIFDVTARDRGPVGTPDPILSKLDESDFQALWLFGVDNGDGLTAEDCAAIGRFRRRGGGLMLTRDHMNLGSSIGSIAHVGLAHCFHDHNINPDIECRQLDDCYTDSILWPNYHSGANGDYQEIRIVEPVHPVLADPDSADGCIRLLPSHPHEGDVRPPPGDGSARTIATGRSKVTGATFNIAVVFEASETGGRVHAESTFHHFVDYNWDITMGKPSFVCEQPGQAMAHCADAQRMVRQYAKNIALWLVGLPTDQERAHQEDLLDEALDESFPASDPPSLR